MSFPSRALVTATLALLPGVTLLAQETRPPVLSPRDTTKQTISEATLDEPIEQFTIAIQTRSGRSGVLTLIWDTTQASVPIRVEK